MTETLVAVTSLENADTDAAAAAIEVPVGRDVDELEVARELVRQARDAGVALTGPDGLLKAITKTVIETALDEELCEHLGYDRHDLRAVEVATPATEPDPTTGASMPCLVASGRNGRGSCCPAAGHGFARCQACIGQPMIPARRSDPNSARRLCAPRLGSGEWVSDGGSAAFLGEVEVDLVGL
jgi:hypothetical protein